MTSRLFLSIAATSALIASAAAHAGDPDGRLQAKLLVTGVLPDGGVSSASGPAAGALAGSNTSGSDQYVPTVALEYFFAPNFSVETICCVTNHSVKGKGNLAGAKLVKDYLILPATVTAKYHFTGLGEMKPYVGAGPAWFVSLGDKPGADAVALGLTNVDISNTFGAALQAGIDIAVNDSGLSFTFDAKRYFVRPKASFFTADGTRVLQTKHDLDPWVISAGVAYRFY
ncbi:MAG: outer membrane beta-barrel protein [Nevskiaceae bacterium]|jgi:outer membrane protein|nr:outer membrane beta-barrel protein [Nevskiaceae bacterium]